MKLKDNHVIFITFFVIGFLLCIKIYSENYYTFLLRENGIVENVSFILYLVSAIIFFIAYFKEKELFKAFIGICCFVFSLEEISYGQSIWQFDSPAFFKIYNTQNEVNLHNLVFFNNDLFFMGILIIIFLIVPLANNRLIRCNKLLVSYRISTLFLLIIVLHLFDSLMNLQFDEVAEMLYSILFLQLGLNILK